MATQSVDDILGASDASRSAAPAGAPGLPTVDSILGPTQPMSGAGQDGWWSSLTNAGTKILNAAGYGIQQGWGSEPLGLSAESDAAMRRAGIFNDWQSGEVNFVKAANEALIRPAATAGDFALRALATPFTAIGGAARETAEQIQGDQMSTVRNVLAAPFGMVGEVAGAIGTGEYPAPELLTAGGTRRVYNAELDAGARQAAIEAEQIRTVNSARSAGVIGEGEAGFYGAHPLTPENAATRASAATEAGITAPPPIPAAPDLHVLARRIDPDTFREYDAAALRKEEARTRIATLADERLRSPEYLAARAEVNELLGIERAGEEAETVARMEAFRASAPEAQLERLDAAQARLDAIMLGDSPEMAQARQELMNADYAMRDLAPEVSAAYRQAQDLNPELPLTAAEAEAPKAAEEMPAAVQERTEPITAEDAARGRVAPVAASPEGEAAVAPPSVTGEEKLGEGEKMKTVPHETAAEPATDKAPLPASSAVNRLLKQPHTFPESAEAALDSIPNGALDADILHAVGRSLEHNDRVPLANFGMRPEEIEALQKAGLADADGTIGYEQHAQLEQLRADRVNGRRPQPTSELKPTARYGNLRAVEGTGERVTRGLSEGVEAKAIEDGLIDRFGDLPEYQRLSMADQAEKARAIIDADWAEAKAIAMGDRPPPKGVLPESVFVGVEKRALANGDVETLRQLATRSRLSTTATTMGQRIRTLGERDAASPVGALQEIQQARAAELAKTVDIPKATRETIAEAKAEIRKAASKPKAWESFIQSITCGPE